MYNIYKIYFSKYSKEFLVLYNLSNLNIANCDKFV